MSGKVAMLTENEKILVNNFMLEFQRANLESEVKFVKARREKDYLKVTITQNGNENWYHVLGKNNWY